MDPGSSPGWRKIEGGLGMGWRLGKKDLSNISQGVAATVELADELDAGDGFVVEETLAGWAFASWFDQAYHYVVLQGLAGDAGLGCGGAYTHERSAGGFRLITQMTTPEASGLGLGEEVS